MATAVIDSINYHRDAIRGRTCRHTLYSSLTAAGLGVSKYQTKAELTTDGPDAVGAIVVGEADTAFKATRKVILSLTYPLTLLYAATVKKITIYLTSDRINPWMLRIYRVTKPPLEAEQIIPPNTIPNTRAKLHQTAHPNTRLPPLLMLRGPLAAFHPKRHHDLPDTTTSPTITQSFLPRRPPHAHGSSLLGGSAKLFTSVDRSSYLARAIDMLLRLRSPTHPSPEMNPADSTTQSHDPARARDTTDEPDTHFAANSQQFDQATAIEKDDPRDKAPTEARW
jgi:hypothetical protein